MKIRIVFEEGEIKSIFSFKIRLSDGLMPFGGGFDNNSIDYVCLN